MPRLILQMPPPSLHIQLLGELRITLGESELTVALKRPASLLLAYLAHRQRRCTRLELIEALWPDGDKAVDSLRQARKRLNDSIPDLSTYVHQGEHLGDLWMELNTEQVSCDLWELRRLSAQVQKHPHAEDVEALCALSSRGLFRLSRPNSWQDELVVTLADEHRAALLWLADRAEADGSAEALQRAELLLQQAERLDPLDETVLRKRLFLLVLQERRIKAQQLWRTYCKKLDLTPMTELTDYAVRLGLLPPPEAKPRPTDHRVQVPASLTALVGRVQERKCIQRFLLTTRLVTLTGIGGVGKTRLAQEIGQELAPLYANGVQFVELAALPETTTPETLCRTLLQTFGIGAPASAGMTSLLDRLGQYLAPRSLLLILDNLEQLLPTATAILPELLVRCRSLSVLTTSRTSTGVIGERVFRVPGLDVPTEAVQLLQERLPLCEPEDFSPLQDIAALVEGLPLALEMAAALWDTFATPSALVESLKSSLTTLRHPTSIALSARHQSMEATFLWSYDQLSLDEQRLFRLGAALPDGGDATAFAQLSGTDTESAEVLLARLRTRSLLQLLPDGRFRLLELVRQLAWKQCSPEERLLAEQRLVAYAHEQVLPRLTAQPATFEPHRRLLETALTIAVAHSLTPSAFALAEALWPLWRIRGSLTDAAHFLERTLALTAPPPRLYLGLGTILYGLGRYDDAIPAFLRALSVFQEGGDLSGEAAAQANLANIYKAQKRLPEARAAIQEALGHFEALGDTFRSAMAQGDLGRVLLEQDEVMEALALHRTSYDTLRSLGDTNACLIQGNNLAFALIQAGQTDEAADLLHALLQEAEEVQHLRGLLQTLVNQLRLTPDAALITRIDTLLERHQLAMPPEAVAFVNSLRNPT